MLGPTSGAVRLFGQAWGEGSERELRQRFGVSLQQTVFFEKQRVREILALFHSFYPQDGRSVQDCIDLLALSEKADAFTTDLSGGQRQRLAVACALVGSPELLFLDEPTTGLDPQSRLRLWEVVRGFRDQGGTVLVTTHYMEEAERLCDRVGIIDHGKLIALGSPAELVASLGGDHVVELQAEGLESLANDGLDRLPGVRGVRLESGTLHLTVEALHVTLPALLDLLEKVGIALDGLKTRHTSLEDVFVELTGRHLRDEE